MSFIVGPLSQNGFGIIQPPLGSSPVATNPNDVLTLTSSDNSIIITGNSGTDTLDFIVNTAVISANSFSTIAVPAGTNPVADSSTDTLTLATANGLLSISGDATTDTITFTVNNASIDHGNLAGLADDDHAQYALLAGRSGGQTLNGGTAAADDLILASTNNASPSNTSLIEFRSGNTAAVARITPDNYLGQGGGPSLWSNNLRVGNLDTYTDGSTVYNLFDDTVAFKSTLVEFQDRLDAGANATGFNAVYVVNPTVDASARVATGKNLNIVVPSTNTATIGELDGLFFNVVVGGSGTVNIAYGLNGYVFGNEDGVTIVDAQAANTLIASISPVGTDTITFSGTTYGMTTQAFSFSGNLVINTFFGFATGASSFASNLTISNFRGVAVTAPTANPGTTITVTSSAVGVLVADQTLYSGTYSSWNFLSEGTNSRNAIEGRLGIGLTAPSASNKLHIDSGTNVAVRIDGSGNTAATATAGAAALPANPVGFLIVNIAGTDRKIPYYAV